MSKEVIKVILDIIKTEMDLDDERILIYNQKWILPNTDDIFVYLNYVSEDIIANNTYYEDRVGGFYEVQTLNKRDVIGINIFSRNNTARTRKDEILMALTSTYAQQQSEKYSIKIAEIPMAFNDVSSVEAAAMLNRYNANIGVFSSIVKEKVVDYYTTFSKESYRSL